MNWKRKFLLPGRETSTKNKICEFPSPFSDNGEIMTGEKSRLVHHDMWILAGEPYFTKPVLLTALRSLRILFYISRSQWLLYELSLCANFLQNCLIMGGSSGCHVWKTPTGLHSAVCYSSHVRQRVPVRNMRTHTMCSKFVFGTSHVGYLKLLLYRNYSQVLSSRNTTQLSRLKKAYQKNNYRWKHMRSQAIFFIWILLYNF